ncbi:hypothetical protein JB92DRAFT_2838925 [Gautieria morchelliformis]|nr:hypothetical protein JB92DRAFT_2838925 [Gautieria morchelliformis]
MARFLGPGLLDQDTQFQWTLSICATEGEVYHVRWRCSLTLVPGVRTRSGGRGEQRKGKLRRVRYSPLSISFPLLRRLASPSYLYHFLLSHTSPSPSPTSTLPIPPPLASPFPPTALLPPPSGLPLRGEGLGGIEEVVRNRRPYETRAGARVDFHASVTEERYRVLLSSTFRPSLIPSSHTYAPLGSTPSAHRSSAQFPSTIDTFPPAVPAPLRAGTSVPWRGSVGCVGAMGAMKAGDSRIGAHVGRKGTRHERSAVEVYAPSYLWVRDSGIGAHVRRKGTRHASFPSFPTHVHVWRTPHRCAVSQASHLRNKVVAGVENSRPAVMTDVDSERWRCPWSGGGRGELKSSGKCADRDRKPVVNVAWQNRDVKPDLRLRFQMPNTQYSHTCIQLRCGAQGVECTCYVCFTLVTPQAQEQDYDTVGGPWTVVAHVAALVMWLMWLCGYNQGFFCGDIFMPKHSEAIQARQRWMRPPRPLLDVRAMLENELFWLIVASLLYLVPPPDATLLRSRSGSQEFLPSLTPIDPVYPHPVHETERGTWIGSSANPLLPRMMASKILMTPPSAGAGVSNEGVACVGSAASNASAAYNGVENTPRRLRVRVRVMKAWPAPRERERGRGRGRGRSRGDPRCGYAGLQAGVIADSTCPPTFKLTPRIDAARVAGTQTQTQTRAAMRLDRPSRGARAYLAWTRRAHVPHPVAAEKASRATWWRGSSRYDGEVQGGVEGGRVVRAAARAVELDPRWRSQVHTRSRECEEWVACLRAERTGAERRPGAVVASQQAISTYRELPSSRLGSPDRHDGTTHATHAPAIQHSPPIHQPSSRSLP